MTVNKQNQAAVREINRMLLQCVRNDWKFPDVPKPLSNLAVDPITYRERYYSASDDSSSESFNGDEEEGEETEEEDPELGDVKFESPDSVAEFIDRRLQVRKRKKRKAMEDEMAWNSGLCFFMRRRNAWTGALTHKQVEAMDTEKDTFMPSAPEETSTDEERTASESTQDSQDPSPQTESPLQSHNLDTAKHAIDSPHLQLTNPSSSSSTPSSPSPFSAPSNPSDISHLLLPIAAPLLPPTHPVRASIMARSPSELYEKVVRDSRTPAVPINLAHMMRVVVQGWKDEGNWPPKSTAVGSSIVLADSVSTGRSEGQRVQAGGLLAGHKHLRQGVESVRRVLRLSGNAPPPGD
jgi:hypothetical protein